MIVQIAVIGAMGLIGLGILTMIISGIKSATQGKQDVKRIAIMAVPFVVFAISYFAVQSTDDPFATAGVLTMGIMLGIMVLGVLFTGLRGTFKF
ncbi:MAG: hypothetical protein JJ971_14470 [Balneolaceae bacterium]|nr:hypothetical protein [Balneolaceae bacterium]MBO6547601.1 hypothetical protein [Balneolaceae bacterium]MBO6648112.1 hypothetical protein [Balneolaceae bacterium]